MSTYKRDEDIKKYIDYLNQQLSRPDYKINPNAAKNYYASQPKPKPKPKQKITAEVDTSDRHTLLNSLKKNSFVKSALNNSVFSSDYREKTFGDNGGFDLGDIWDVAKTGFKAVPAVAQSIGVFGGNDTKTAKQTFKDGLAEGVQGIYARSGTNFTAGVGDLGKGVGDTLRWMSTKDGLGGEYSRKAGEAISDFSQKHLIDGFEKPYEKEFGWSSLLDPEFYASSVARSLPFTMSLIMPSVAGATAGAKLGGAVSTVTKLGKWGQRIAKTTGAALGGSAVSVPLEAAFEAANVFDEAVRNGHSEEDASAMADKTFTGNAALLSATQIPEMALTFAHLGGFKPGALKRAGMLAATAALEGGQEAGQEIISAHAQGNKVNKNAMWESAAVGTIMGAGMGTVGALSGTDPAPGETPNPAPITGPSREESLAHANQILGEGANPNLIIRTNTRQRMSEGLRNDFEDYRDHLEGQGYEQEEIENHLDDYIESTDEGKQLMDEETEALIKRVTPEPASTTTEQPITGQEIQQSVRTELENRLEENTKVITPLEDEYNDLLLNKPVGYQQRLRELNKELTPHEKERKRIEKRLAKQPQSPTDQLKQEVQQRNEQVDQISGQVDALQQQATEQQPGQELNLSQEETNFIFGGQETTTPETTAQQQPVLEPTVNTTQVEQPQTSPTKTMEERRQEHEAKRNEQTKSLFTQEEIESLLNPETKQETPSEEQNQTDEYPIGSKVTVKGINHELTVTDNSDPQKLITKGTSDKPITVWRASIEKGETPVKNTPKQEETAKPNEKRKYSQGEVNSLLARFSAKVALGSMTEEELEQFDTELMNAHGDAEIGAVIQKYLPDGENVIEQTKKKTEEPKEKAQENDSKKEIETPEKETQQSEQEESYFYSDGVEYFATRKDKETKYTVNEVNRDEDGKVKLGKKLDDRMIDTVLKRSRSGFSPSEHERLVKGRTAAEERDRRIEYDEKYRSSPSRNLKNMNEILAYIKEHNLSVPLRFQTEYDSVKKAMEGVIKDFKMPWEMSLAEFMKDESWKAIHSGGTAKETKNAHYMQMPNLEYYPGGNTAYGRTPKVAKQKFHEDTIHWQLRTDPDLVSPKAVETYPKSKMDLANSKKVGELVSVNAEDYTFSIIVNGEKQTRPMKEIPHNYSDKKGYFGGFIGKELIGRPVGDWDMNNVITTAVKGKIEKSMPYKVGDVISLPLTNSTQSNFKIKSINGAELEVQRMDKQGREISGSQDGHYITWKQLKNEKSPEKTTKDEPKRDDSSDMKNIHPSLQNTETMMEFLNENFGGKVKVSFANYIQKAGIPEEIAQEKGQPYTKFNIANLLEEANYLRKLNGKSAPKVDNQYKVGDKVLYGGMGEWVIWKITGDKLGPLHLKKEMDYAMEYRETTVSMVELVTKSQKPNEKEEKAPTTNINKDSDKVKAVTAAGTEIEVAYKFIEAHNLIVSHNVMGMENSKFPKNLQPRDRSSVDSVEQISEMARNIDPLRLGESRMASDGAPIVGSDMVVESGNGRILALMKMYSNKKGNGHINRSAQEYEKFLRDFAKEHNMDMDMNEMSQPVLVRVRLTEVNREKFVAEANESSVSNMGVSETALADAKKMDSIIGLFVPSESGEINTAYNKDFIQKFVNEVVPAADRREVRTSEGHLSQGGLERLERALFALAYNDRSALEQYSEDLDDNARTVTGAMVDVSPKMAILNSEIKKGTILEEFEISKDVVVAFKKLVELRRKGENITKWIKEDKAQESLFDDTKLSGIAYELLHQFSTLKSQKKIRTLLFNYVEYALNDPRSTGEDLFGGKATKAEFLQIAIERMNGGGDLFGLETQARPSTNTKTSDETGKQEETGKREDNAGKRAPKPLKVEQPIPVNVKSDKYDKARSRLDRLAANAEKFLEQEKGKGRLNSLPLDLYAAVAIVGAKKIAMGVIDFAEWSEQMATTYGSKLRLSLRSLYAQSEDMLNYSDDDWDEYLSSTGTEFLDQEEEEVPAPIVSEKNNYKVGDTVYYQGREWKVTKTNLYDTNSVIEIKQGKKQTELTSSHVTAELFQIDDVVLFTDIGNGRPETFKDYIGVIRSVEIAKSLGEHEYAQVEVANGEIHKVVISKLKKESTEEPTSNSKEPTEPKEKSPEDVWEEMKKHMAGMGSTTAQTKFKHLEKMKDFAKKHGIDFSENLEERYQKFGRQAEKEKQDKADEKQKEKEAAAKKELTNESYQEQQRALKEDLEPGRQMVAYDKLSSYKRFLDLSKTEQKSLITKLLKRIEGKTDRVAVTLMDNDLKWDTFLGLQEETDSAFEQYLKEKYYDGEIKDVIVFSGEEFEVKEGENDVRTDEIRNDGEETLEGVPTNDVQGPGTIGGTGNDAVQSTGTNEEPSIETNGGRDGGLRSPGDRISTNDSTTGRNELGPQNYRITEKDKIGISGKKNSTKINMDVIRLAKQITSEGRAATPEEQAQLVQFIGWGGLKEALDYDYMLKPEWRALNTELKELLTKEEFASAQGSRLNAHFTSPEVISALYEGLKHFGFEGGRVLEPSIGVGHFVGLVPDELHKKTRFTGVELEPVTGAIAKLLYPKSDIRVEGFEFAKLADGFYDIAIGNVPFGDYKVLDPKYEKAGLTSQIHNYFFAKALDKVHPGGLVMFITSKGTMDSAGATVRKYLSSKAEFIGAIRLPDNAFSESAGTQVVTDVIILKRLPDGVTAKNKEWLHVAPLEIDGSSANINKYFVEHPEMMLGTPSLGGGMYRGNSFTLTGKGDLKAQLDKALKSLPGGIFDKKTQKVLTLDEVERLTIAAPDDVKEGAYHVQDGKLYVNQESQLVLYKGKSKEEIKGYIKVRTSYRKLINAQLDKKTDSLLTGYRKELNVAYDSFVKKFGYINLADKALQEDPDFYLVSGLEKYDKKTKIATKSDVFTTNTSSRYVPPVNASTPNEALTVSLNETGTVQIKRIADLLHISEEQAVEQLGELVYKNPVGSYETSEEYLSGNIREKVTLAENATVLDPTYQRNVDMLQKVMPKDLEAHEIEAKPGAGWVGERYTKEFVAYLLDWGGSRARDLTVNYSPFSAEWSVAVGGDGKTVNASELFARRWGSRYKRNTDMIEAALNGKTLKVMRTVYDARGFEKKVMDKKATFEVRQRINALRDEYKKWIWQDDTRKADLIRTYNDRFNNLVLRKYNGEHMPDSLPNMNPHIKLREHQKTAIFRMLQRMNTLLAHAVGAGKTFEMIGGIMEMRRLGQIQKPIWTVPNGLVGQMATDFMLMYPGANIYVPTAKDFEKTNRKKMFAKIASNQYDAIIMGHSSFGLLSMSTDNVERFFAQQIEQLELAIEQEVQSGQRKKSRARSSLEKMKKSLIVKMNKKLLAMRQDTNTATFEELGVDAVVVDEAHEFKNLMYGTKLSNIGGLGNPEGADMAFDMFMKVRYLQQNGGKVVFATGTPISNSLAEMYHMMRYLAYDELENLGLNNFDAWANLFVDIKNVMELAPEGKNFRMKERIRDITNAGDVLTQFRDFADVRNTKELLEKGLITHPKTVRETVLIPASDELLTLIEDLGERAEAIRRGSVDPADDNPLKISMHGRWGALDMRLMDGSLPNNPNFKLNHVKTNVANVYRKTMKEKGTQLVFMDTMQTHLSGDFNTYKELKNLLIREGIPANEIAFIHDAKNKAEKEILLAKVNDGTIRILIGSRPKMGAGMNVQTRLKAAHQVDVPWRPSDIEQSEGRILRQGNEFFDEVEIYTYVQERSFDAYIWQLVEGKARVISSAMSGDLTARRIEDNSDMVLTASQIKALATGDTRIIDWENAKMRTEELESEQDSHNRNVADSNRTLAQLPGLIQQFEGERDYLIKESGKVVSTQGDNFSIVFGGIKFTKRADAAHKLFAEMEKVKSKKQYGIPETIGSLSGFEIKYIYTRQTMFGGTEEFFIEELYLSGAALKKYANIGTETGTITSLENQLASIKIDAKEKIENVKDLKEKKVKLEILVSESFQKAEELEASRKKRDELAIELNMEVDVQEEVVLDEEGELEESENDFDVKAPTGFELTEEPVAETPTRTALKDAYQNEQEKQEEPTGPVKKLIRTWDILATVEKVHVDFEDVWTVKASAPGKDWKKFNSFMQDHGGEYHLADDKTKVFRSKFTFDHYPESVLMEQTNDGPSESVEQPKESPEQSVSPNTPSSSQRTVKGYTAEVETSKHTQTGAEIWLVRIKDEIPAEKYGLFAGFMRQHGGKYYNKKSALVDFRESFVFQKNPEPIFDKPMEIEEELSSRINESLPNLEGGYISFRGSRANQRKYSFEDPVIQQRIDDAEVIPKDGFKTMMKNWLSRQKRRITREYEHLPHTGEFSPLRHELLRLEKQRGVAIEETANNLHGLLVNIDRDQYELFRNLVLTADLMEEASLGHELPFSFTEASLTHEYNRLQGFLANEPKVAESIALRKKLWAKIKVDYIKAFGSIGVDVANKFGKENYYRHIIIEKAKERKVNQITGQKELKTPKGQGYMKQRKGSEKDFVSDYLLAESEVMSNMLFDIEVAKSVQLVDEKYNIEAKLKAEAGEANNKAYNKLVAAEVKESERMADLSQSGLTDDEINEIIKREAVLPERAKLVVKDYIIQYKLKLGKTHETQIQATAAAIKGRVGWAYSELKKLAVAGDLWTGKDDEYSDLVDDLANGVNNSDKNYWFEYLSDLLSSNENGAEWAGKFLTYTRLKNTFREDLIGKEDFKTVLNSIPEGYSIWQPDKGNIFFMADTLPEYLAKRLFDGALDELTEGDFTKALVMAGKKKGFIVKDEVKTTLENLMPQSEFTTFKTVSRFVKRILLIGPINVFKYNARNMTGDLDKVIAGNPDSLKYVVKATAELGRVYFRHGAPSKELKEWLRHGGVQTLLQAQDFGELKNLSVFRDMITKKEMGIVAKTLNIPMKTWNLYWDSARKLTDYREAILRYASFLSYLNQIEKNNGNPKNYGASLRREINALDGKYNKAFNLSNDLLIAYDKTSVTGKKARDTLIPFMSFAEGNIRSYIRLFKNAYYDEQLTGAVGRKLLGTVLVKSPMMAIRTGKLALSVTFITVLTALYNSLFWPDEEEELSEDVQRSVHVVLGRNSKGEVIYFNKLGTLQDFLGWFGLSEIHYDVADILDGKKTFLETIGMNSVKVVNKGVQMVHPIAKQAVEQAVGLRLFPDFTSPSRIADRKEHLAGLFTANKEYAAIRDIAKGRPHKRYKFENFVAYSSVPDETNYYKVRDQVDVAAKKYLGKEKALNIGKRSIKSEYLYEMKLGLHYGDRDYAQVYLEKYYAAGGTDQGLKQSLKSLDPLSQIPVDSRQDYYDSLNTKDQDRVERATEYYETVLLDEFAIEDEFE